MSKKVTPDTKIDYKPSDLMWAAKVVASQARPYFAPGIFAMPIVETTGVETLACDRYWRLYYNPAILGQFTVKHLAGAITHELYHCILDHHARFEELGGDEYLRQNLAGDLAINPAVVADMDRTKERITPLPDWACFPKDFGFEDNLSMEAYYQLLDGHPKLPSQGQNGKGKGAGKGSGKSAKTPQPTAGQCGSCAGGPAQPYEQPAPTPKGEHEGVSKDHGELVRQKIANEVIRYSQESTSRGSLPAGLVRWAQSYLTPKINWMAWVRALMANAYQTAARGCSDWSYRVPSRRQHAFGKFIRPGMIQHKVRVGFIVDTSGSMSDTMLERCHAEVKGFMQQIRDSADMWLLSVDAAAYGIEKIENVNQIKFKGGGGTDMRIGFEAFEHMRPRMDLVVCLTDCHTPWPEHKPTGTIAIVRVGTGEIPTWPCRSVVIQEEEAA